MKRHPALIALSRDHHTALVWAKRLQRSGEVDPAMLMAQLITVFEHELEPHFRTEESDILPVLQRQGHHALVSQTLEEHRFLRAEIEQIRAGCAQSLVSFGTALAAHVRFEERVMFPAVESALRHQIDRGQPDPTNGYSRHTCKNRT